MVFWCVRVVCVVVCVVWGGVRVERGGKGRGRQSQGRERRSQDRVQIVIATN